MSRHVSRPVFAALFALLLAGGCGSEVEPGSAQDAGVEVRSGDVSGGQGSQLEPPVDDAAEILGDGVHTAWLSSIDDRILVLKPVEVLSGEEAVTAAKEEGGSAAEGPPNDVYVQDLGDFFHGVPIADDATIELLDCTGACEPVMVALDDFLSGTVRPYGGERPLVRVEVVEGEIASVVEQYLP